MAIYHLSIKNVSRAKGSNALRSAAYALRTQMHCERTGETIDYSKKTDLLWSGVLLPEGAPVEFSDPEILFNSIENHESAVTARTAKKIEASLPKECSLEEQVKICESFAKQLVSKGYCVTYGIHDQKDQNGNFHVHYVIPNRPLEKDGSWQKVKRKMVYELDAKGERIPLIDRKTGQQKVDARNRKQWKRISVVMDPLSDKKTLMQLRERWAAECNKYLRKEQQIDHRSYKAQGISKLPSLHEGYFAQQLAVLGNPSSLIKENDELAIINRYLEKLRAFLTVTAKLIDHYNRLRDSVHERLKPTHKPSLRFH